MNITKETHIELKPQIQGFTDYTKIIISRMNPNQKIRLNTYDQRRMTFASERRLLRVLREPQWKQSIDLFGGFGGSAYLTYTPPVANWETFVMIYQMGDRYFLIYTGSKADCKAALAVEQRKTRALLRYELISSSDGRVVETNITFLAFGDIDRLAKSANSQPDP